MPPNATQMPPTYDSGALASMTFGDKKAVTINTTMTEADFSGAKLGVSGAIILAGWLKHK